MISSASLLPRVTHWKPSRQTWDVLICAAGFEDRTFALANTIAPGSISKALVVSYKDWDPRNRVDDVSAMLESKSIHVITPALSYDRFEPDQFADNLADALIGLGGHRVVLDISTMSKLCILLCLDVAQQLNLDLTLFYAEAEAYEPTRQQYEGARRDPEFLRPSIQVYSGVGGVIRSRRLSSVAMQGEPSAAIVFMSMNDSLTQALVNAIYPTRLFLINGRSPSHPWREAATAWIHEQLRQEWAGNDNPVTTGPDGDPLPLRVTSTLQYIETVDILRDLYWQLAADYRVIMSPTGAKMQTVGCFIAKALHRDIHIEYPTPKGFLNEYSTGIRQAWGLHFGPFADVISRLRYAERQLRFQFPVGA